MKPWSECVRDALIFWLFLAGVALALAVLCYCMVVIPELTLCFLGFTATVLVLRNT